MKIKISVHFVKCRIFENVRQGEIVIFHFSLTFHGVFGKIGGSENMETSQFISTIKTRGKFDEIPDTRNFRFTQRQFFALWVMPDVRFICKRDNASSRQRVYVAESTLPRRSNNGTEKWGKKKQTKAFQSILSSRSTISPGRKFETTFFVLNAKFLITSIVQLFLKNFHFFGQDFEKIFSFRQFYDFLILFL